MTYVLNPNEAPQSPPVNELFAWIVKGQDREGVMSFESLGIAMPAIAATLDTAMKMAPIAVAARQLSGFKIELRRYVITDVITSTDAPNNPGSAWGWAWP